MGQFKNTPENTAIVAALKKVSETDWVGTIKFQDMDYALRSVNMNSNNGGLYNPTAVRVPGVYGWFMENKDGSIFFEARVIKKDEKVFLVEHLTDKGFSQFEAEYNKQMAHI